MIGVLGDDGNQNHKVMICIKKNSNFTKYNISITETLQGVSLSYGHMSMCPARAP